MNPEKILFIFLYVYLGIIFIGSITFIIIIFSQTVIFQINEDCFEQIAIKECAERGYNYDASYSKFLGKSAYFYCLEDTRQEGELKLKFTDAEYNRCAR